MQSGFTAKLIFGQFRFALGDDKVVLINNQMQVGQFFAARRFASQ
jgi:hypothetical protein